MSILLMIGGIFTRAEPWGKRNPRKERWSTVSATPELRNEV